MQTPEQLTAELYDLSMPDWDGEIDFYASWLTKSAPRENGSEMIWFAGNKPR